MSPVYQHEQRLRELKELRARIDHEIHRLELDQGNRGRARKVPRRRAAPQSSDGPRAADIRAWANANGYQMGTRGRIRQEIRDAYLNAQNGATP